MDEHLVWNELCQGDTTIRQSPASLFQSSLRNEQFVG